jgi:repressor LexA
VAVEEILDYEEITPELAATGDFFGLRIKGRSMEPRMHEGDVVIVRQQSYIDNGNIAVILVNGENATVKRVQTSPHGLALIPFNHEYPVIPYTHDEIEKLPVEIIGKVVELRAKF